MSQPLTLARPYARAAFELASSGNALADWARKLAFAAQAAADPQAHALIGDPRVTPAELASLFLPDGEPIDSPFANFVKLLADNHRLEALPEIAALFEQHKREAEKILQVRVRSATPIDAGEAAKLKDALKRRFGRDIELEQTVDPSVLGGAVIDAGDVVIDGSVRGRLHQLEAALTH
ncbi:MAG TPA: F0F1 ATP synthase subunit delta [Rhodanobacteraceae bacterium]|jgi:F-type H+-transporting ATPase subunit delta|nr:F0F1 ATP synthase subunit delta [Rhodanobacteraceae bacterium]